MVTHLYDSLETIKVPSRLAIGAHEIVLIVVVMWVLSPLTRTGDVTFRPIIPGDANCNYSPPGLCEISSQRGVDEGTGTAFLSRFGMPEVEARQYQSKMTEWILESVYGRKSTEGVPREGVARET